MKKLDENKFQRLVKQHRNGGPKWYFWQEHESKEAAMENGYPDGHPIRWTRDQYSGIFLDSDEEVSRVIERDGDGEEFVYSIEDMEEEPEL